MLTTILISVREKYLRVLFLLIGEVYLSSDVVVHVRPLTSTTKLIHLWLLLLLKLPSLLLPFLSPLCSLLLGVQLESTIVGYHGNGDCQHLLQELGYHYSLLLLMLMCASMLCSWCCGHCDNDINHNSDCQRCS